MTTLTLTSGQISPIIQIGKGTRVTSSGNGTIEYYPGALADAKNGGTFETWPKGTAAGSVDALRGMCSRATATGAMVVTLEEGRNDFSADGAYWDSEYATLSTDVNGNTVLVGADGNSVLRGPMVSGAWFTSPSVFRLRLTGTGAVQFDSRDSAGTVTAVATYTLAGATDQIEFPYAGDNAVAIRATLTGTTTVEVI